jgi:NADPH:quinone reductase-like Zn-dependent oxidoreductase
MKYKHIVISRFGGPESLLIAEDELLEPRANEVRVKVLAVGVSFADILMRKGVHPESWNLGILAEHHLLQDGCCWSC